MNILALDTATVSGFAFNCGKGDNYSIISGVIDASIRTKATRTEKVDHFGKRFDLFESKVNSLIVENEIGLIVYEKVVGGRTAGGNTAMIQKGLEAIVWKCGFYASIFDHHAARDNIPVWNFAAGTIKKWATNNGTLGKTGKFEMVAAAQQLKRGVTDDNEADALWIHDLASNVYAQVGAKSLEMSPEQLTVEARRLTSIKWSRASRR